MKTICNQFPITEEEYKKLDKEFIKLAWKAAHDLKRKNTRNNFLDDPEDIKQELVISMMRAGSYTKRQKYIEKCFVVVKKYVQDSFLKNIVFQLEELWKDRTKHGANRQKFGNFQEDLLQKIVKNCVPKKDWPNKKAPLEFDQKFSNYCKSIMWNGQKSMGKKITKEKSIRSGQVSLSEFSNFF